MIAGRLVRRYPVLFGFTAFLAVTSIAMNGLYFSGAKASRLYFYTWSLLSFVNISFFLFVLLEVAEKLMEGYRGFEYVGSMILRGGLIASGALVAGFWLLAPEAWVRTGEQFFRLESTVIWVSLLAVWAGFGALARYYRLSASANVRVIYGVLAADLLGKALFSGWVMSEWAQPAYAAGSLWHAVCYGAAVVKLSPAGEATPVPILPVSSDPAQAELAVAQLESANRSLLRLLKRS